MLADCDGTVSCSLLHSLWLMTGKLCLSQTIHTKFPHGKQNLLFLTSNYACPLKPKPFSDLTRKIKTHIKYYTGILQNIQPSFYPIIQEAANTEELRLPAVSQHCHAAQTRLSIFLCNLHLIFSTWEDYLLPCSWPSWSCLSTSTHRLPTQSHFFPRFQHFLSRTSTQLQAIILHTHQAVSSIPAA